MHGISVQRWREGEFKVRLRSCLVVTLNYEAIWGVWRSWPVYRSFNIKGLFQLGRCAGIKV